MANYITTSDILPTIRHILGSASQVVIILPHQAFDADSPFAEWRPSFETLEDITLILSGSNTGSPKLTAEVISPLLQCRSLCIYRDEQSIISRVVSDRECLLLPNGLLTLASSKAGVLSNLGMSHQLDIRESTGRSEIVFHKKPQYKTRYFGLQKTFEQSEVVEDKYGISQH
ncbi:MAG: hypothetical protein KDC12_04250 [Flavobacteriales bacterium]|nr:hypothetical protein [Flavobacteriales bacterium]